MALVAIYKILEDVSVKVASPLKSIRAYCIMCSGGSAKAVAYCPCHGCGTSFCPLWPYRFGVRPATVIKKMGIAMLNPSMMPSPDVPLEGLPTNPRLYQPEAK